MFITKRDVQLMLVFTITFLVGIFIGFSIPKPEPTYELVQIKGGNAYVVDFNQSLTDCQVQVRDNPKANLACIKE